jgi:hypothetical protein
MQIEENQISKKIWMIYSLEAAQNLLEGKLKSKLSLIYNKTSNKILSNLNKQKIFNQVIQEINQAALEHKQFNHQAVREIKFHNNLQKSKDQIVDQKLNLNLSQNHKLKSRLLKHQIISTQLKVLDLLVKFKQSLSTSQLKALL